MACIWSPAGITEQHQIENPFSIFVYKLKLNSYTGFVADKDFEILDDLPNLDDVILQVEIELVSSRLLYDVPRPKSEEGTSGESSNLCKGSHRTTTKTTER